MASSVSVVSLRAVLGRAPPIRNADKRGAQTPRKWATMTRMSLDVRAVVYLFGPFRLDVNERRLQKDGEIIPLAGKAFDTLVLLVAGAGTLQKQQGLVDRLWPDVAVEPNNLQQNVSLVRRALSNAADVEIETVRGQGYRLHATVRLEEAESHAASGHSDRRSAGALDNGPHAQRLQFCTARDGTRLAYARLGQGQPLVKAANWLSHLELDAGSPVWKHWLARLSRDHCLIRYDARGNGLSDWNPPTIRFSDFVSDLGIVFDAAGVQRAPLLGISQGASASVAYAAQNPERVSALILIGGCARGWRVKRHPKLTERIEALMILMRQGWGTEYPAFRHIFTTSFFPAAEKEQMDWFNELQRQTTSPTNAAELLSALGDVDVREDLPRLDVPTLVVHSRGDTVVPIKDGIELAAGIRGARFIELDSKNHILLEGEPAWSRFDRELGEFLREVEA
jgi:pimeloyl-ACP methyl ester carboxylesterase/DNA-binding winged helix-turn-helix (wHTH) protein